MVALHPVLSADQRHTVLAAATTAPSMHNTQPWKLTAEADRVDIRFDPARALPAEDPDARMAGIACGAAVFNALLALNHLGFAARVDLLPDSGPLPWCRLVPTARWHIHSWEVLYAAIPARRTNRYPFYDEPVPDGLLAELAEAASDENARLDVVTDPDRRQRLVALTHAADAATRDDNARVIEQLRWIGAEPGALEGVPYEAVGPHPADARSPFRDLAPGMDIPERSDLPFESSPALAVLSTRHDRPADWIAAGQALQHLLLLGTVRGLAFSLVNQPLEHPELRRRLGPVFGDHGHPQALLRIGYPMTTVMPTPRRDPASATEHPTAASGTA